MVTAMNKHLTTLLFFLLALVLYFIGLALAATIFLLFGALAEGIFWLRLFRGGRHKPDS
jgi:threonine/homoserine efflux transporter RhtA